MKKYLISLLACLAAMCASCTLSEPSEPSGDASALRLKSVKVLGVNLIKFDYDNQGRITKINAGELTYQFSYDSSSSTPSEILCKTYDTFYDYQTDKETTALDEESLWTNIQMNASGYITSCHCRTKFYSYPNGYSDPYIEEEEYTQNFNYQNDHLTSIRSNDPSDGMFFDWNNDLLVRKYDADGDDVTFEYTDVDNIASQWDPNNEILGPILATGFFGKAPAKLTASATYKDMYSSHDYSIQYSYSLFENGLIQFSRVLDSDDPEYVPTLNYVYEKAK